ncbi:MAG: tetratricopeptide repeat protein, partial [Planctomycetota bacterium]
MTNNRPKTQCSNGQTAGDLDAAGKRSLYTRKGLFAGLILLVAVVVLITYWPVLSSQALSFDDHDYLTDNKLVGNPSWASAQRFLTEILTPSTVEGYYQPLAMISLMLDYSMGGRSDNLSPFRRTSLLLHIANVVLIALFLYLLFGRPWPAALVGLLFGVHPITVEVLAWLGERKTLLATFFSLWSLVFYVRHSQTEGWKYYVGCVVMYVLALMSKPTSTPLPVLMFFLDFWPLQRLSVRSVAEKIPLLAIGGISAFITTYSQGQSQYPLINILMITCHNIIFYLYNIFWPAHLSLIYPFPEPLSLSHPMILTGVLGSAGLVAALLVSLRWTRALLTGWLFFFIAIFPTFMVVGYSLGIAEDKYVYFPLLGLLLCLGWLLCRFWERSPDSGPRMAGKAVTVLVVLILAGSEAFATRHYLGYWRDTETLYRHALEMTPNEAEPHLSLGVHLYGCGRVAESIEHYSRALEINPHYYKARCNLGRILMEQGKYDAAIEHLTIALRLKPDFAKANLNLGLVYAYQGQYERSIVYFQKALERDPEYFKAHYNLAAALARLDRVDESIKHFSEAIALNPRHADSYCGMGLMLARKAKYEEAGKAFKE